MNWQKNVIHVKKHLSVISMPGMWPTQRNHGLLKNVIDLSLAKEKKRMRKIKTEISEEKSIHSGGNRTADENILRPKCLNDYVGQEKLKESIKVASASAKARNTAMDHVLLYGPPGLGKTTMAYIIANEMNAKLKYVSGPNIQKPGDIAAVLSTLQNQDVVFIDEIHRINPACEEILYSAMEDGFIMISVGSNDGQGKQIRLTQPPFTLVGATTRAGMLSKPLQDRFGIVRKLEYYQPEELARIVMATAGKYEISITLEQALDIAKRSRGTPRIANNCVARVRDMAFARYSGKVEDITVKEALELAGISENGLTEEDYQLIDSLSLEKPVGLQTLTCILGESEDTITELLEPYLIMQGYMEKTPRGRILTEKGAKL